MDGLETNGNVVDPEMRGTAGGMKVEPIPPQLPPSASAASSPAAPKAASVSPAPNGTKADAKPAKIFAADLPHGQDALGLDALLQPLAELAAHRATEAPLAIGLLGGTGSGKSFALGRLMLAVESLSTAPATENNERFLKPVLTVAIDAMRLTDPPSVALAGAVYDRLADKYPELAREAAHAVRDPQVVARDAAEELDIGRRRLDAERQKLAEIESRRAKLPETILFEQAGSQVDSYARANRAKIESRLEGFGVTGEAISNYKSMLRDIAESGGPSARLGTALRAFWAFKGQGRLLAIAIICVLIAIVCDIASGHQQQWLDELHNANGMGATAGWLSAHIGALGIIKQLAYLGALAAIAVNLWRGIRFLRPLYRGVNLLEAEVAERRQDLDALYAHQTRRVDALVSEVELTGRRADEADRRAAVAGAAERKDPSPFAASTPQTQAERFFAALAEAIQRGRKIGEVTPSALPRRIVIGLDNVDRLPQAQAFALLDAASRDFAQPAFVTIVAADVQQLAGGAPEAGVLLKKWIQVPLHIGAQWDDSQAALLVAHALGTVDESVGAVPPQPLEWSVSGEETSLLTTLAPLAGTSPRAVKRFVNLYRVARAYAPDDKAVLALMLAVSEGGNVSDIAAVERALAAAPDAAFLLHEARPRLRGALAAVEAMHGPVTVETARRAMAIVQALSLQH